MGSPSPTLPSHSQPSSSSLNMFLVFLLSLSVASVASQCVLTPSTENVVSTQLVVNWTLDKDLTTRIWPSVMDRIPTDQELIQTFVDNPEDCTATTSQMVGGQWRTGRPVPSF